MDATSSQDVPATVATDIMTSKPVVDSRKRRREEEESEGEGAGKGPRRQRPREVGGG